LWINYGRRAAGDAAGGFAPEVSVTSFCRANSFRNWVVEKSGGAQREIVAMNEQTQTNLVHPIRLRERQRLSDETSQTLTQCIVPPLNMRRLTTVFAARRMLR